MSEFIQRITQRTKELWSRIDRNQKILVVVLVGVVFLSLVYLVQFVSEDGEVLLYPQGLGKADFQRVQEKLDGMNVEYSVSGDRYIFVSSEEEAIRLRAMLGVRGIVRDLKGYELFDNPSFSITDFERRINLRRAITGNIVRHLESLEDIESAEVVISFGEDRSFFLEEIEDNPLTASVSITPEPFSDLSENKNKIRGLRDFIAKSVDRLRTENVIIINQQDGSVLTDKIEPSQSDEKLRLAQEQMKIQNKIKREKIQDVRRILTPVYTEGRYKMSIEYELDWDVKEVFKKQIDPIVLKEDNPRTVFDEREVIEKVERSREKTTETFKGPSFIPEGPAGTEPNVAPGTKELVDRYSDYKKERELVNNELSESEIRQENSPYRVKNVKIAVVLDGIWEKVLDEEGSIQLDVQGRIVREYIPVSEEEIQRVTGLLEGSVDRQRGDLVEVQHIQFDRRKELEKEDQEFRDALRNQRLLLIGVASLLVLVLVILLFRVLKKELDRRRRIREEELAREQQAMREAALLAAEEEGLGLDLPPEDRERMELQENTQNIARERPQDVAALLKTWMAEE